jgi:hypothetical protein
MTTSPFRADAVVFLAVLLDTTPEIVLTCAADSNTAEGLRTAHQLQVAERFAEAMHQRGQIVIETPQAIR